MYRLITDSGKTSGLPRYGGILSRTRLQKQQTHRRTDLQNGSEQPVASALQKIVFNDFSWFFFSLLSQHSVELFKAAQQRSNKPSLFQEYANRAQRNYNEVKKDNDFIYHERIPDYKSLEAIGKANVAKLLPLAQPMSTNFKGMWNLFDQEYIQ